MRSRAVTHTAELFTRGFAVSHTPPVTRPRGDTVSHTRWHRLTRSHPLARGPTGSARAATRPHTMTGHLTRRPRGPRDRESSSPPPSGSVPPSVRSVCGSRKPSAPAGRGGDSIGGLTGAFTKGPPRAGGQRAAAAGPAGKWSPRTGATHPGTAGQARLGGSGRRPLEWSSPRCRSPRPSDLEPGSSPSQTGRPSAALRSPAQA